MEKNEILEKIKKSKKYSGFSESVILREIEKYSKRFPSWKKYKPEFIAKEIKRELHKAYGSFQTYKKGKREKLFNEFLKDTKNIEQLKKILRTNLSTKERIPSYDFVYDKIFEITGKPTSILDLGCGLNPLSFQYMGIDKDVRYYAYDLNQDDISFVQNFFNALGINGQASIIDLKNIREVRCLPATNVCFMFKVLDPLEKSEKGHKLAEEIIKIIANKCNFIAVSFAAKTLSGKKMNFPRRGWIEKMLGRIGIKYFKFNIDNEIFYVLSTKEFREI